MPGSESRQRTASFKPGDVVKVPFPYIDRATRQRRPALIVSGPALEHDHGVVWLLMITSAGNRGWPGDVNIANLDTAGLPAASVIRSAKIASINARDAERLGSVNKRTLATVMRRVARIMPDLP